MKYSNKIEKEHKNRIEKVYHRKDSSFGMMITKAMLKEIERNEYDSEKYSVRDIELISQYLYEEWQKYLEEWIVKLEERKKEGWW